MSGLLEDTHGCYGNMDVTVFQKQDDFDFGFWNK